jgi:serine protease AprX
VRSKEFAVAVFGALLLAFPGRAAERQADPRIFEGKDPGENASFLVVMRGQADLYGAASIRDKIEKRRFVYEALRAAANEGQANLRSWLDAAGVPYRSFYVFNMIEVKGSRSLAQELANREDVAYVAANRPARLKPRPRLSPEEAAEAATAAVPRAQATVEPNIAVIRAPEVWARGFTGQGIVIGMADTGFKWDHPALEPHYRGFNGASVSHDYNWHDAIHNAQTGNPCGSNTPAPCDDDGHGTATASLAVGDDGTGNQVGVARSSAAATWTKATAHRPATPSASSSFSRRLTTREPIHVRTLPRMW